MVLESSGPAMGMSTNEVLALGRSGRCVPHGVPAARPSAPVPVRSASDDASARPVSGGEDGRWLGCSFPGRPPGAVRSYVLAVRWRAPRESSGSYRAYGGGLQGCPAPRPPATAAVRLSCSNGRPIAAMTAGLGVHHPRPQGRPRRRPPPWTSRRRSARGGREAPPTPPAAARDTRTVTVWGAARESAPRLPLGQASRSRSGGSCVIPCEHGAHAAVKGVDEKPTSPRRAQHRVGGPRTAGYGWIGDRR